MYSQCQICVVAIFLVAGLLSMQSFCDGKRDCSQHDYYQELERALISDAENLFKLQQLFFPVTVNHTPNDKHTFNVCMISSAQNTTNNGTKTCWAFEYSNSLLTGLISPAQLHAFESAVTVILVNYVQFHNGESIELLVRTFPCTVKDRQLTASLAILTSWFKAYARARGVPHEWKDEDKGYVAKGYGFWNSEDAAPDPHHDHLRHFIRVNLLIAFVLLNVIVVLLLLRFVPRYYHYLVKSLSKTRFKHAENMFWTFTLFTIGWNILVHVDYCSSYGVVLYTLRSHCFEIDPLASCSPNLPSSLYKDDLSAYITKVASVLITLVVYLLLAAYTPKASRYPIPYSVRRLCCCFGCCCRSNNSKIIQTFVLWNILLFVHFVTMTTIPIVVFIFLAPAKTIAVLATFITFILITLIVIAHVLEFVNSRRRIRGNQPSQFCCMHQCIQLTVIVAISALVIVVLVVYHTVLVNGTDIHRSGVYGIVWSLLPSFILSLVGWYMKWKFSQQQELQEVLIDA